MHHTDGSDEQARAAGLHEAPRHPYAVPALEAVLLTHEHFDHVGFGPHVDGAEVRKRAQVVESGHVVEMFVGEEHSFERGHGVGEARRLVQSGGAGLFVAHFGDVPFVVGEGRVGAVRVSGDEAQHLRAEVGPAVDEQEAMVRNPETAYLVSNEEYDKQLEELGWSPADMVTMAKMYLDRKMYEIKKGIRDFFREILELMFQAAALVIDTIRTFFLPSSSWQRPIWFLFFFF